MLDKSLYLAPVTSVTVHGFNVVHYCGVDDIVFNATPGLRRRFTVSETDRSFLLGPHFREEALKLIHVDGHSADRTGFAFFVPQPRLHACLQKYEWPSGT